MRPLIGALAMLVALSALASCPAQDLDPSKFPDAWWLPHGSGVDAGAGPDATAAGPDAQAPTSDAAAQWLPQPPQGLTSYQLNGIAGVDTTLVAVGDKGLILSWTGSSWAKATPAPNDLKAVCFTSATSGWFVGSGGYAAQWSGSPATLKPAVTGSSADLRAVAVLGKQGWAAGAAGARWSYDTQAKTWADHSTGALDVVGMWSSGTSIWAAASDGKIFQIDAAGTWTLAASTPYTLFSVFGFSDEDLWFAADGTFLHGHKDGSGKMIFPFTPVPSGSEKLTWRVVWGAAPDDVWAAAKEKAFMHWNGSNWSQIQDFDGTTGNIIYGLWGTSALGTLAVGDSVALKLEP